MNICSAMVLRKKKSVFSTGLSIQKDFAIRGENKDIDLLFAGYFDEYKGPQRALEIIHRVSEELPGIRALFIGKGPLYHSITERANELGLSENITFAGYVNDAENYFKRSHILLFPSANEGLSTAMLEAMACRCVTITSDVGNQTEAALHNHNSIVISDWNDLEGFSSNAIRLLNDKILLNRLAENGEKTILGKYTPEAQGRICQRFYAMLLLGNN